MMILSNIFCLFASLAAFLSSSALNLNLKVFLFYNLFDGFFNCRSYQLTVFPTDWCLNCKIFSLTSFPTKNFPTYRIFQLTGSQQAGLPISGICPKWQFLQIRVSWEGKLGNVSVGNVVSLELGSRRTDTSPNSRLPLHKGVYNIWATFGKLFPILQVKAIFRPGQNEVLVLVQEFCFCYLE